MTSILIPPTIWATRVIPVSTFLVPADPASPFLPVATSNAPRASTMAASTTAHPHSPYSPGTTVYVPRSCSLIPPTTQQSANSLAGTSQLTSTSTATHTVTVMQVSRSAQSVPQFEYDPTATSSSGSDVISTSTSTSSAQSLTPTSTSTTSFASRGPSGIEGGSCARRIVLLLVAMGTLSRMLDM